MTSGKPSFDDDYLWDQSGDPDPEIAQLEELLSPVRFDEPLDPEAERDPHVIRLRRHRWWPTALALAAAAVLIVIIGGRWGGEGAARKDSTWTPRVVEYRPHFAGTSKRGIPLWVPGLVIESRTAKRGGTPYLHTASPKLLAALRRFDFDNGGDPALDVVLAEARSSDAVTLWYLLQRASSAQRGRIHDRLVELVPPPEGVTRAGVMAGDGRALAGWGQSIARSWSQRDDDR